MYFDSHFHLDHFAAKEIIPEMITRAEEAQVTKMLAIGGSDEANKLAFTTSLEYPGKIWCSAGYDRDMAPGWNGNITQLRELLGKPEVVAVGECGIDYFHNTCTPDEQKRLFGAMIDLAVEFKKPVIVHSREADEDSLEMLTELSQKWTDKNRSSAVLHCYTGSVAFAEKLLELGLMISFSGIVTFKNAADLREVATMVPDDRLLIETDSPYLAPVPHRGKRNEPAFVPHVAEMLAETRKISQEEIAALSTRNACSFLDLPSSE